MVWLMGLLTTVSLIAGAISFWLARDDATELLDHQLQMLAGSVYEGQRLSALESQRSGEDEEEQESDYVIQVQLMGSAIRSSRSDVILPIKTHTGFSDMAVSGRKWRSYTMVYANRTVQASQSEEVRSEIAMDAALHAMLPIAVLIPLSWVLVFVAVSRFLKPLSQVIQALAENDAASPGLLPAHRIPDEVTPLIAAMNRLLMRIRDIIESQRNFMFDAAHELRTPLAALQLQIDNLSQHRSGEDLDALILQLQAGVKRASRLISQLLKMARYEAERETIRTQLDLNELIKTSVCQFIPISQSRGIDLGINQDEPALIWGNADDLGILLDNLLDNAIRYTGEGGSVDVSVRIDGHQALVEIRDTGPGIPEHLLVRVFDRFFRAAGQQTTGSGIGLAIVSAISKRENVQVNLANRRDRTGLISTVHFNRCVC